MFFFPITPSARARYRTARTLYTACIERSRQPEFYAEMGVPDTFDGRFEVTALHVGLAIERMSREESGTKLAQALFDEMFLNMDQTCRELGIGDLGVPKHIKRMMKALKGRTMSYRAAIETQDEMALYLALTRNLYGTLQQAPDKPVVVAMGAYVQAYAGKLDASPLEEFLAARLEFPPVPRIKDIKNGQASQAA